MPPRGQAEKAPFGATYLRSFRPLPIAEAARPGSPSKTFSHERRLNKLAGMGHAHKRRVPALQPTAACPAPIAAAGAFGHDPLQAELAGVGEHGRALGREGFAEHDAVDAVDEERELVAPLLERVMTEILAGEAEEVEGDE